jgi:hypothetical protein
MTEYYVHILNWGPIEAERPEEAAKMAHSDISGNIFPVYNVTEEQVCVDMWTVEEDGTAPWRVHSIEVDSEEWEEDL